MISFNQAVVLAFVICALLFETQILMFAYLEKQNLHLWSDQLDLNQKIVNSVYQQCGS